MKYVPVGLKSSVRYGLGGLKYSPMDLIAMMSEQTGTLIIAGILTRADLGVYGLCQQFVGAADTPGWSVVQSQYPELVRTRLGIAAALRSRVIKLSLVVALLVLASAAVLGQYVYKIPGFLLMMAILTLSIPSRYLNNFYYQTLRAAGCIRIGTNLSIAKLLFGLAAFWTLGSTMGLWGCIVASLILSAGSAALYRYRALPILESGK